MHATEELDQHGLSKSLSSARERAARGRRWAAFSGATQKMAHAQAHGISYESYFKDDLVQVPSLKADLEQV
jgi:hypothetical protein